MQSFFTRKIAQSEMEVNFKAFAWRKNDLIKIVAGECLSIRIEKRVLIEICSLSCINCMIVVQ